MKSRRAVRRAGVTAAVVAALAIYTLLADWIISVNRAALEQPGIDALVEQVKTEATIAPVLEEARKRQADASLARKARARFMAWTLLVAGAVFVACGKRYMALEPQPLPGLDTLVAERFAPSRAGKKARRAPPAEPPDPASDLSAVDALIERFGRGREAAIPILQGIQAHFGYLPDEALDHVCARTEITPAQIAGTSSFYAQFRRSPVGRHVVRVCHGTACHVAGAEQITAELRRCRGIEPGEDTDPRRLFTIDRVACLGCCSLAPVMMIGQDTAGRLTPALARQTLAAVEAEP